MPTYAGVNLAQPTQELADWVQKYIPLTDVVQFAPMLAMERLNSILPYGSQLSRSIKLGSLWWPQGASRWATGFFIATEEQINTIRDPVYSGNGYQPQDLVLDDETTQITASMWMLPPRPLAQSPPNDASFLKWVLPKHFLDPNTNIPIDEPIYLLPLVDDRYFWWQRASTTKILDDTMTWATLLTTIGDDLSVGITYDAIESVYLKVPQAFVAYQMYAPLLLDLAAFATGRRVIRGLDNSVSLQTATKALAQVATNLAANKDSRMSGGQFALDLS